MLHPSGGLALPGFTSRDLTWGNFFSDFSISLIFHFLFSWGLAIGYFHEKELKSRNWNAAGNWLPHQDYLRSCILEISWKKHWPSHGKGSYSLANKGISNRDSGAIALEIVYITLTTWLGKYGGAVYNDLQNAHAVVTSWRFWKENTFELTFWNKKNV